MSALIPLYFAHGNGFPSESYHELFDALAPDFQISYSSMLGHDVYPVSDNWPHLVSELIAHIKASGIFPVVGVGHSMGGILMFLAACRAPELFQEIILLDAPLLGFWRSRLLYLAKRFALMRYLTPIEQTRGRRIYFDSLRQAFDYFKTKKLFKNFTDKSLELYVKFGLNQIENGYILRFNREIETNIFATFPHNLINYQLPADFKRSLIYSIQGSVTKYDLKVMRKGYGFQLKLFPQGSHLFPFEYPKETAQQIGAIVFNTAHEALK
jgi:pimeloyl-ACP methyl ester carboxylesterase